MVVKACRSGNVRLAPTTNPPLRNAYYIIGPICANGNQCSKERVNSLRKIGIEGETLHNYTQICVKRRMVSWIDSRLVRIVFFYRLNTRLKAIKCTYDTTPTCQY